MHDFLFHSAKKGKITAVPSHPQIISPRLWPGGPQQELKGVEGNVSLLRLCLLAATLVWEGHLSLHKSLSFIFAALLVLITASGMSLKAETDRLHNDRTRVTISSSC